jgi:hypothetical protein
VPHSVTQSLSHADRRTTHAPSHSDSDTARPAVGQ